MHDVCSARGLVVCPWLPKHDSGYWQRAFGMKYIHASCFLILYPCISWLIQGGNLEYRIVLARCSLKMGIFGCQIAKLLGARVVAVDLGPDKANFLRSQGADAVIDAGQATKEQPLHKMIKSAAPKG